MKPKEDWNSILHSVVKAITLRRKSFDSGKTHPNIIPSKIVSIG